MENDHSVEQTTIEGPGASLAAAREKSGMTQDQVADKLHLSPRQIVALEANRYDDLPEAPYVRGYIRNYAILLDLDDAALVEAFNASRGVKKKTYDNSQQNKIEPVKRTKKSDSVDIIKFAGIGVAAILAIVVIVWALLSGDDDSAVQQANSSQITDQHFKQTQQQAIEALNGQSETLTEQAEQVSAETPVSEQTEDAATGSTTAVTEGTAALPAGSEQLPADRPAAKPDSATPADSVKTPSPSSAVTLSQVVLYVEADSWADIRDANDRKLIYETVAGGRVVTLEGKAPIKVFLGNARAVKLFYNGKEFNFSQYQRGLVARFTLQ